MKIDKIYINFENLIKSVSKLKKNENKKRFIISLSGGPDSIFLVYLFNLYLSKNNDIEIFVTHIRHRWNELDSKQEEWEVIGQKYCEEICKKFGFKLYINSVDEKIEKIKFGMHAAAREFRYKILNNFYDKFDADYIVIGHNLDDYIENFFIRMYRGAGLSGLSGMQDVKDRYLRPILNLRKKEIELILKELQIDYFVDEYNIIEDYLRNKIRAKLIPVLYEIDERFELNFKRMINNIDQVNEILFDLSDEQWKNVFDEKNKSIKIDKILELKPYLQKEILIKFFILNNFDKKFFNNAIFEEVLRFLENRSNKHQIGKFLLVKFRKNLKIENI